jgi:hypothetical protein
MSGFDALEVRAGARAAAQVGRDGLSASDIACIPAAAGGPKGLALIALDKLLFGHWLAGARRLELVGASVGAWRMACAAQPEPARALQRFADAYVEQRYSPRPTRHEVTASIRRLASEVLDRRTLTMRPGLGLNLVTSRARGPLQGRASRAAFARAALANARSRAALAAHLERVVFQGGTPSFGGRAFDAFGFTRVTLDARNAEDALAATGSIPMLCDPMPDPAGAPGGDYWDGGLIDYHIAWPYADVGGLVLYPHFVPYVTAGWLDKFLPWRKRNRAHPWLDNVLLLAPSRLFLQRLPHGRLPDRGDFRRYGTDAAARIRDWRRALAETERFAEQAMRWLERPDPGLIGAL